ncbi:putative nuclear membrane fusion protein Kar5 [Aspergillus undulatus]|uniref:putative nuclear membrane fusion protein Kar5 n=1 Tax=Aspergillus undulatus TaxID=1810928 RepID=UPI003CCD6A5A
MTGLFRLTLASYAFLLYTSLFQIVGGTATAMNVVPGHTQNGGDAVLTFFNARTPSSTDELFTKALDILESNNSSSSCNRLAAEKLVTSCATIGRNPGNPSDADAYLSLEHTRSVYAARLAICELSGAGINIPHACQSVNILRPPKKGYFGFYTTNTLATTATEIVSKQELEPCLKSLESRPQSWTSYSNSRQNAMVICEATRSEIEKEGILQTYKDIVKSSTKLSSGLFEALRMAAEESGKNKAFMQSTEVLRRETLREMEKSMASLIAKASRDLEARYASHMEAVSSALSSVHTSFSHLQKDIQASSNEAESLRHLLQYIDDELVLRSQQIALTQQQNAKTQNELALSLQSRLQSVSRGDLSRLTQDVGTLATSLEWIYARIGQIHEQEVGVSERLRGIGTSLEEFQLRANTLDQAQQRQYEITTAQWQLQEDLQEHIRISQALVNQTMSQAANLQTLVGETAGNVKMITQHIPGTDTFSTYSSWIICGICCILISMFAFLILLFGIGVRYITTGRR